MNETGSLNIVLFDGVCNLCNATVLFLIKHDKQENLHFVSLQSDAGKHILNQFGIPNHFNSVLFIKKGQVFNKSEAVIEITKSLMGWPRIFRYIAVLPIGFRNMCYDLIAKNRYSIFGKRDHCSIPKEAIKKRFLS